MLVFVFQDGHGAGLLGFTPVGGVETIIPLLVLALAGAALGGALWALPRLGSEFLPELNEGSLYITCTLPSNISLTEGRKLVPRITAILKQYPEVEEVLSQLGRPEDGTDATLTNNL